MAASLLIALIRVYQLTLSKLIRLTLGNVCRFEPSCSRYAVLCLEGHGALRGSLLSIKRLCKCHPFHPGGYDPPPPRDDARAMLSYTPGASITPANTLPAGALASAAEAPVGGDLHPAPLPAPPALAPKEGASQNGPMG